MSRPEKRAGNLRRSESYLGDIWVIVDFVTSALWFRSFWRCETTGFSIPWNTCDVLFAANKKGYIECFFYSKKSLLVRFAKVGPRLLLLYFSMSGVMLQVRYANYLPVEANGFYLREDFDSAKTETVGRYDVVVELSSCLVCASFR